MLKGVVWITWERQVRNESLASRLKVELFEIIIKSSRFIRYFKSFYLTRKIIRSKLPKVVIAPNPSLVLAYTLLFLQRFYRFSIIVDAHLAGVQSFHGIPFFQWALNNYNKRVDLVIVTNDDHADYIRNLGGKSFVCQDPLPFVPNVIEIKNISFEKSIFFICSFDLDEPYATVFDAFNILRKKGYSFFVSGNYKKVDIDINKYPYIKFLGFVSSDEFYGYIRQCSVLVDVTTLENCLVCGAYEAIAAGKPIVVSNTKALKAYFSPVAVFTENSPSEIANSIDHAYENRDKISNDIKNWVLQNEKHMAVKIKNLNSLIMSMIRFKV